MSLLDHIVLMAGEGNAAEARLFLLNSGTTDDGVAITPRVRWQRAAPAGADGECCFTGVVLACTWLEAGTATVQAFVDNQPVELGTVTFVDPGGVARTESFFLPLTVPIKGLDGVTVVGRRYPRGAWVEIEVTLPGAGGTRAWIDGIEIEFEVMRAGRDGAGTVA